MNTDIILAKRRAESVVLGKEQPLFENIWVHPKGKSYGTNITKLPITSAILQEYINRCPPTLSLLKINNAYISSIEEVQFPQTLTTLDLDNNQIVNLNGVKFPDNLETLSLSSNNIKTLEGVQFPPNLIKLLLNGNKLKSFNGVKFPPNLTELKLHDNPLETLGTIIEPTENVLQLIERQFPRIVEQYRQNITRQSQQTEQATLKEISDFNQISLQNQLRGITSFLREGMEARAEQHIETLKREEGKELFYVSLIPNEKKYPVPLDTTQTVQCVLDYINENYYISSLVPNCGVISFSKEDVGDLDLKRSLSDYNVAIDTTLIAKCGDAKISRGGGRVTKNKSKESKKWSMKYKRSINCRRPRGFSQRQHCKYGRRGRAAATRRKSKSARE